MKDTWYADQRDLVKWGTLAYLAERHSLAAIVQVAYLRSGKRPPLSNGTGEVPISPVVWAFFRDVAAVRNLGKLLQRSIVVINEPFVPQRRRQYREAVVAALRWVESPKIVLLDPDTGISPSKPSGKHITTDDLTAIWGVLRSGDWLAVYQHRFRSKSWKEQSRQKFAQVCGNTVQLYEAPKIASDVVLLTKRKP